MTLFFALLRRTLAAAAFVAVASATSLAQAPPPQQQPPPPAADNGTLPAGGHFKECHGYVRHVSDLNMRVHCIDGNPSDQSFLYLPKYTNLKDGKSIQTTDLRPDTPVHVIYTQSVGIKKAYKIFVADPNGHGLYGFRS
ncbi:MAG TPA: hypothetical protein VGP41_02625 [Candidatus Lustribacter sp.]|jgi:hypothetical protein|nr:hypothetical protein [Candidatus Lustribacter sp.]